MVFKPLTERIEIQRMSLTGTSYNQEETWSTVRTIFASITNQRGQMKDKDGQQYLDGISFFCRYTPIEKKGMRILHKDQVYNIINITNVQRNENTVIDCVAAF